MNHGWNAIFTLLAVALTLLGVLLGLPWDYTVFSIGLIALFASFSWGISNARYTQPIFPLFLVLARLQPGWRLVSAAVCLPLLFYFTQVYTRGTCAFYVSTESAALGAEVRIGRQLSAAWSALFSGWPRRWPAEPTPAASARWRGVPSAWAACARRRP